MCLTQKIGCQQLVIKRLGYWSQTHKCIICNWIFATPLGWECPITLTIVSVSVHKHIISSLILLASLKKVIAWPAKILSLFCLFKSSLQAVFKVSYSCLLSLSDAVNELSPLGFLVSYVVPNGKGQVIYCWKIEVFE